MTGAAEQDDLFQAACERISQRQTEEICRAQGIDTSSVRVIVNGYDVTDKMPLTRAVLEEQRASATAAKNTKTDANYA